MSKILFALLYQPLYNLLILITAFLPGHSVGWAIVLLTIIVRLILLPSSLKAAHLQVKNLEIQPKINKIRAEIKDQHEQSKALMSLYKEEGFSPFGSCLPLIIQLVILFALFRVFTNGLSGSGYSALYPFVKQPEFLGLNFFGFDLTRPNALLLPAIAAVLQIVLSFLMMPRKKKGEEKTEAKSNDPMAMMNKQMLFLPAIMTFFFGRTMPAALIVYWITTTVFGIFQQLYVNKKIRNEKIAKAAGMSAAIENTPIKSESAKSEPAKETTKGKIEDRLLRSMSKKLDKQERKAGVNVVVRQKK